MEKVLKGFIEESEANVDLIVATIEILRKGKMKVGTYLKSRKIASAVNLARKWVSCGCDT